MPHIRPAVVTDVDYLAPRLRRPDVEECLASYGHPPLQALDHSFTVSPFKGTVMDDVEPVGMYGVGPTLVADVGSPWFLATPALYRPHVRRFFLRETRNVVERMHAHFPILIQHVDARHQHALRWMLWSGFVIDELVPEWGYLKLPFFRLSKIRTV